MYMEDDGGDISIKFDHNSNKYIYKNNNKINENN